MKKRANLTLFFFLAVSVTVFAQTSRRDFVVPYVTSDQAVIEGMLTLARVTEDDIVYDLGCGDGRIIIMAAQKFGARGVGIDINPVRIEESNENAAKAGVTDLVEFRAGSFFEEDFSDATVVAMYLTEAVNIRLRPYFFRDLKPGTRIVTHDFGMGEWQPDLSTRVESSGGWGAQTVFFWLLPANVSGDWTWTEGEGTQRRSFRLHIDQKFQNVTGTLEVDGGDCQIGNMQITGDTFLLSVGEQRGADVVITIYGGTVSGDTVTGSAMTEQTSVDWEAKRAPETVVELDPMPEE